MKYLFLLLCLPVLAQAQISTRPAGNVDQLARDSVTQHNTRITEMVDSNAVQRTAINRWAVDTTAAIRATVNSGFLRSGTTLSPANVADSAKARFIVADTGYFKRIRLRDTNNVIYYNDGNALLHTFGWRNLFIGRGAGNFSLTGATAASMANIGIGDHVFTSLTTGANNIVMGYAGMYYTTTGSNNTGMGDAALWKNTVGGQNSGFGAYALGEVSLGSYNCAFGFNSMYNYVGRNDRGVDIYDWNTGIGSRALYRTINGQGNTALGANAGVYVQGDNNLYLGWNAGNGVGADDTTSNKLIIGSNFLGNSKLILGRFDLNKVQVAAAPTGEITSADSNFSVATGGVAIKDGGLYVQKNITSFGTGYFYQALGVGRAYASTGYGNTLDVQGAIWSQRPGAGILYGLVLANDAGAVRGTVGLDASDHINITAPASSKDIVLTTSGTLKLQTNAGAAGSAKVGSLVVSDSFSDSAPTNGVYSKGQVKAAGYFVNALQAAPANASDTGTAGEIRFGSDYIYVCVATNTWKRVAIATW